MKKLIQEEKFKLYCDLTGKEITNSDEYGSIDLNLLFFDKKALIDSTTDCDYSPVSKTEAKRYSDDWYYTDDFNVLVCEDVAIAVFNFLKKNYPKYFKQNSCEDVILVKRGDRTEENKLLNKIYSNCKNTARKG